jgi:hypothetical protein
MRPPEESGLFTFHLLGPKNFCQARVSVQGSRGGWPLWVDRVALTVRQTLPVFPMDRHRQHWSACLKGGS